MSKMLLTAPLPFVGQKRTFAKQLAKLLPQFENARVFVDLFGGSGLLSHVAKRICPDARVVYNDYDNYSLRLKNIPQTNRLLADLRKMAEGVPTKGRIGEGSKGQMLQRIRLAEREDGFIDFVTLSANILFSMKYATTIPELEKQGFYNKIVQKGYTPDTDYLQGIEVVHCDYKVLIEQYKDVPGVVFLVDPPYLNTDVCTYSMSWQLADYLDVLTVLNGRSFVYFTSNKTNIPELCDWIGKNPCMKNPFADCSKAEVRTSMNYSSRYIDMMYYSSHGRKTLLN